MVIQTTNKNYVDLVQTMYMAFNSRDMDEWTKYFDEDTLDYVPSLKEPLKGRKAIRENNEEFIKGIPDVSFEMTNIFGQNNWVCAEGIVSGTYAHSKKSFRVPVCMVAKFEGEIVREIHEYFDQQSFQV
ncbi:MAG: nuclear transport factor 2 family protein [Promethearchaeota archaeon]